MILLTDINILKDPFEEKYIEWRPQGKPRNGKVSMLAYVDARAIMDRLDQVAGPGFWQDEYQHLSTGVMCKIKIGFKQAEKEDLIWISKEDGSPETNIESFKGGISKSFVRCAVKWGIGRYLYDLGETEVDLIQGYGAPRQSIKDGQNWYHWQKPFLPFWAIPNQEASVEVHNIFKTLEKRIEDLSKGNLQVPKGNRSGFVVHDELNNAMDNLESELNLKKIDLFKVCTLVEEVASFALFSELTKSTKWKQRTQGIL